MSSSLQIGYCSSGRTRYVNPPDISYIGCLDCDGGYHHKDDLGDEEEDIQPAPIKLCDTGKKRYEGLPDLCFKYITCSECYGYHSEDEEGCDDGIEDDEGCDDGIEDDEESEEDIQPAPIKLCDTGKKRYEGLSDLCFKYNGYEIITTFTTEDVNVVKTRDVKVEKVDDIEETKDVKYEEDYKQKYFDLLNTVVHVDTSNEVYTPSVFARTILQSTTSSSTPVIPPIEKHVFTWEYENDSGGWSPVDKDWAIVMMSHFDTTSKSLQTFVFRHGDFYYDISITCNLGSQTNKTTNKKRLIRCLRTIEIVKPKLHLVEIDPLYNWGIPGVIFDETILKAFKLPTGNPTKIESVVSGSDEYLEIEGRFLHLGYNNNPSMLSRGAKITNIERLISPNVAKKYLLSKTLLGANRERLLFHGCKTTSIFSNIFRDGLDARESAAGLLGYGIYMGDSPYYPHEGGFTGNPDSKGVRKMFVVACITGTEHIAGDVFHASYSVQNMYNCKKTPPSGYHSISGLTSADNCGIYCIYDNSQCYVTHVVSYIL